LSFVVIALFSCQKQQPNVVNNTTNTVYIEPTLSANVEGNSVVFITSTNNDPFHNSDVELDGVSKYYGMSILFPTPSDTETVVITKGASYSTMSLDSANKYWWAISGTISVTSFNKSTGLFSGVFNCVIQRDSASGNGQIAVTKGVFSNY
jgi:hypothetical protein